MKKSKISDLSLRTKIFVFTMMPFVLVMIIISILSIQHRIEDERKLTSNRIESYVILLESGDLSFSSIKQKEKIEKLLNEKVLSAELIKKDRSIAFTTGGSVYEINKEQIDKAFQGYIITFTRQNKILVQISLHPIIVKNTVVGIFHLELSFEKSNDRVRQYILFVLHLNIFGIILSFLLIYFLSQKIILNRLKSLTDMCSEVRRGNLNHRLSVNSHDELGILALTFNDTADRLAERNQRLKEEQQKGLDNIRELEKYRDHLEELVKERTIELEGKTKKLTKSRQSLTLLLEDVNESRAELDLSNRKLEASNKKLEAFSYSVSHDLRAPLRHIDGFTKLLNKNIKNKIDEKSQNYFDNIINSSKQMNKLIDDLLIFSRLSRKDMKKIKFNMKIAIDEALQTFDSDIKENNISITVDDMPDVNLDVSLIQQAWINLISNAIKFTGNNKNPEIHIGTDKDTDGNAIFFIKDNGVGFDQKYVGKIFDVFQRLHNINEFPGTGIGLANVKRIITKHGGNIRAEGKINKGASFFFTLSDV
ncbi:ATP-binding protein [Desulfobacula sp.]|uniref:sensor histidine kinase n=1 Tax=Desulfobacula sp. TaxID=2593537 RepID=UPI0025BFD827|nr:ATP-binding protein [Desulfobacula sp.]MBC2704615.1 HAMP domain-containing protein [Desulfobacula sp.]